MVRTVKIQQFFSKIEKIVTLKICTIVTKYLKLPACDLGLTVCTVDAGLGGAGWIPGTSNLEKIFSRLVLVLG